jgi:hypothetical protein
MIRLKMGKPIVWEETRAGWNYVMNLLSQFASEEGIRFDGTLDQTFGYGYRFNKSNDVIPYREPWIGFMHSSIGLCPFLKDEYLLLDDIILSEDFTDSLPFCKGIFALSENVANHIRQQLSGSINVENLKHPTEFPGSNFDYKKFLTAKKVVHAGVWLRRVSSFYQLRAAGYKKILLLNPRLLGYLGSELNYYLDLRIDVQSVNILHRLPNDDYDRLLSESVVFLHFCDCSASNTVVECIARGTPLLVNRLAPVEEYLGGDYPFYYTSMEEASEKLSDMPLIKRTAEYLDEFPGKKEVSAEYFVDSFLNSDIVKGLVPASMHNRE